MAAETQTFANGEKVKVNVGQTLYVAGVIISYAGNGVYMFKADIVNAETKPVAENRIKKID